MKIKNALFLLILVSFIACTKSSEKKLIGVWTGSELSIKSDSLKMDSTIWNENREAHKSTTYEFMKNHDYQVKMNYKGNSTVSNGKWHFDKKTNGLTVIDTVSGTVQDHLIVKINSEDLVLKSTFAFGEVTAKFKKK